MKRLACLALGLLAILALGCQSTPSQRSGPQKSRSRYAVAWDSLEVVGLLPVGSSAADITALTLLEPRLQDALVARELPFVVLRPAQLSAAAARMEQEALYTRMADYWLDAKRINKLDLQALCRALEIDALLGANIEEWTQQRTQAGSTEPSFTRISLTLEVWPASSGRRGWRERITERVEAQQVESARGQTGKQEHGIARTSTAGVEPPRFEEVADEIAREAAETLAEAAGS